MHEGDAILHAEFTSTEVGSVEKHPADVNAHTANAPACGPGAKHLGFSAAQVEHLGVFVERGNLADE